MARLLSVQALEHLPVAQAVVAAVLTVSELDAKQRQGCAWVAAAVRGAVSALPARPATDLAWMVESVLVMPDASCPRKAARTPREPGEHELAARVQRLSKGRNMQCHPDTGLLQDVAAYVARQVEDGSTECMGGRG